MNSLRNFFETRGCTPRKLQNWLLGESANQDASIGIFQYFNERMINDKSLMGISFDSQ